MTIMLGTHDSCLPGDDADLPQHLQSRLPSYGMLTMRLLVERDLLANACMAIAGQ